MSLNATTIKPNNHCVHPCPNDKKLALVHELISQNRDEDIIVVTSGDAKTIQESLKDVKVLDDKRLIKDQELKCTLLISFDVPAKALIYMARLSHTTFRALLLINESEQKLLYPIETLLGRVIKQDIVSGFEYEIEEKPKQDMKTFSKPLSKEKIKEIAKKEFDKINQEPQHGEKKEGESKPKRDYKEKKEFKKDDKWAKKNKTPNKYLGKDENGKAIFSGKSGDRNHRYDGTPRDKWDAPKKVGRKINIKSLKKPKEK